MDAATRQTYTRQAGTSDPVERDRVLREFEKAVLASYKQRVLEAARGAQSSEGWCESGLRQAMEDLDIEVPPQKCGVTVSVLLGRVQGTVDIEIEADSEDDAWEQAREGNMLVRDMTARLTEAGVVIPEGWEVDSWSVEGAWEK